MRLKFCVLKERGKKLKVKREKEKIILANGPEVKILSYVAVLFTGTKMWPCFPLRDQAVTAPLLFLPLYSIMESTFCSSPTSKRNFFSD